MSGGTEKQHNRNYDQTKSILPTNTLRYGQKKFLILVRKMHPFAQIRFHLQSIPHSISYELHSTKLRSKRNPLYKQKQEDLKRQKMNFKHLQFLYWQFVLKIKLKKKVVFQVAEAGLIQNFRTQNRKKTKKLGQGYDNIYCCTTDTDIRLKKATQSQHKIRNRKLPQKITSKIAWRTHLHFIKSSPK